MVAATGCRSRHPIDHQCVCLRVLLLFVESGHVDGVILPAVLGQTGQCTTKIQIRVPNQPSFVPVPASSASKAQKTSQWLSVPHEGRPRENERRTEKRKRNKVGRREQGGLHGLAHDDPTRPKERTDTRRPEQMGDAPAHVLSNAARLACLAWLSDNKPASLPRCPVSGQGAQHIHPSCLLLLLLAATRSFDEIDTGEAKARYRSPLVLGLLGVSNAVGVHSVRAALRDLRRPLLVWGFGALCDGDDE